MIWRVWEPHAAPSHNRVVIKQSGVVSEQCYSLGTHGSATRVSINCRNSKLPCVTSSPASATFTPAFKSGIAIISMMFCIALRSAQRRGWSPLFRAHQRAKPCRSDRVFILRQFDEPCASHSASSALYTKRFACRMSYAFGQAALCLQVSLFATHLVLVPLRCM